MISVDTGQHMLRFELLVANLAHVKLDLGHNSSGQIDACVCSMSNTMMLQKQAPPAVGSTSGANTAISSNMCDRS